MKTSTVRLHISPFNPDLLPTLLGPSIIQLATNISFHTLQTFPESGYGYVDLPQMEAEKVKKKLNGAILKGRKVKVEEARSKKRKHANEPAIEQKESEQITKNLASKRHKPLTKDNVIQGHELDSSRKVKRGWTDNTSGKSKRKDKTKPQAKPQAHSKYTDKNELLFRTKIPKPKISLSSPETDAATNSNGSVVIHEFEKSTTTPSFLRDEVTDNQVNVVYEDGKGWVDAKGNLVEPESIRMSHQRKAGPSIGATHIDAQTPNDMGRSISGASIFTPSTETTLSPRLRSKEDRNQQANGKGVENREEGGLSSEHGHQTTSDATDDDTTSSGTSTSESSSSAMSSAVKHSAADSKKLSVRKNLPQRSLHPLESLFKKPTVPASSHDVAKPSLEIQTSFSFFDSHEENDALPPIPATPFSSQDLYKREIRSAAPTPDTAHPSRMNSIFNGEESEGELSEMEDNPVGTAEFRNGQAQPIQGKTLQVSETDFEKQFWEKRGENNRAWKARRRAVLKEKRQKENRARRPRNW